MASLKDRLEAIEKRLEILEGDKKPSNIGDKPKNTKGKK